MCYWMLAHESLCRRVAMSSFVNRSLPNGNRVNDRRLVATSSTHVSSPPLVLSHIFLFSSSSFARFAVFSLHRHFARYHSLVASCIPPSCRAPVQTLRYVVRRPPPRARLPALPPLAPPLESLCPACTTFATSSTLPRRHISYLARHGSAIGRGSYASKP